MNTSIGLTYLAPLFSGQEVPEHIRREVEAATWFNPPAPKTPRALQAVGTGVLVGRRINYPLLQTDTADVRAWQGGRIGLGAR